MAGRPRVRPESEYIRGPISVEVPTPIRENGVPVGYEWKPVDIVKMLNMSPGYSPFLEAEGYYFCGDTFKKFMLFVIQECVYPEGEDYCGKPFVPETWQWCIYANMFCWFRESDGRRRFREVFIYVPRKNGKTSAFGMVPTLWEFFCGTEKRAQLFCCAADIGQASVNFRHSMFNVESNNRLLGRLLNSKVNRSTRSFEHKNGKTFKVLSSIADTKHGLSPSFVYADEIHAHKDSELIDVMITGMASRKNPMLIYTTTADYDRESFCNRLYDRAKSIRDGLQSDPSFYPVIYEAAVTDDYKDRRVWEKANPNFGLSIYPEHFDQMLRTAEQNPAELAKFQRLHLNIQTKTETAWIAPHVWANGVAQMDDKLTVDEVKAHFRKYPLWYNVAEGHDLDKTSSDLYIQQYLNYWTWHIKQVEDLQTEECIGGFDNAGTEDIAAFSLFFPAKRVLLCWGWCPGDGIYKRAQKQKVPYGRWYEAGLINKTKLAHMDEDAIVKTLIGDSTCKGILSHFRGFTNLCFDRWCNNHIINKVEEFGFPVRVYPQGFVGMNEPCRFVNKELANLDFWHGGNPVLDWMISNVTIQQSNMGQIRPSKDKSVDKIDMVVASLMAIGGYIYPDSTIISDIRGLG